MKEIENDFIKFWFEDGILFSKYKKDVKLDIEAVTTIIEMREKISVGKSQYWLYDITSVKSVTTEARHYVGKHGHNFVYACAVIVNSYITKFLFTSYLKFRKPDLPIASFTTKDKAMEWLFRIKAQNKLS